MERHINIVAALHIIYSFLGILIALLASTILNLIGDFANDMEADIVLSIIANAITVFFTIIAIPGILGGIGLIKRKEWARILILIISVLNLLNFPIGTAIGGYSIWALIQPEVVAEFKSIGSQEPYAE